MYPLLSNSAGHAAERQIPRCHRSAHHSFLPVDRPRLDSNKPSSSGEVFADTELAYNHYTSLFGLVQHEVLMEDCYDLHEIFYIRLYDRKLC